jgi:hypothetical protein
MAWTLLDSLRNGQAALHHFQKHLLCREYAYDLVTVDVFETDIKHWWFLHFSSHLSSDLFNRSTRTKCAVCMYVCMYVRMYVCKK